MRRSFASDNGFSTIVERAEACRLDRRFYGAVAGHHHHRAVEAGGSARPFTQQRDAVGIRHPDVEQHEVGVLTRPCGTRLRRVGGNVDLVAFLRKNFPQETADVGFIVDDQNAR